MIRITENKLIIEINTPQPLSTLSDFQNGLLTMIQIANINSMNSTETVSEGIRQTSMLIKEMLFSYDQMDKINDSLDKTAFEEFNRM